jgi:hypothetical protein
MSTVSLTDSDGLDPLPICRRNREWLIDYYKSPEGIVLRFFSDATPVRQRDKSEEAHSIKHVRECPRCRAWLPTIVSEETYRRQARQARYCCAGMFCAVEEHESRQTPRFSFTMFRDEDPCWQVDGKNAFAVYCPWCGTKLPAGPFIKDGRVSS